MSLADAANALLSTIHAPRGTVNILPVREEAGSQLVVWVDAQYLQKMQPLPDFFEGYRVSVVARPTATSYRH